MNCSNCKKPVQVDWRFCARCGDDLARVVDERIIARADHLLKPKRKVREPNRPDWLKAYSTGYDGGEKWDCLYDGMRWALIRVPGGRTWSARGETRYYKAQFQVVRKAGRVGYHPTVFTFPGKDTWLYQHESWPSNHRPSVFVVHEGRMNQDLLRRLSAEVHYLDDRGL